ncbi:MAG: tail fiber domain-containing protein [Panacibacter sp.]
MFATTAAGNFSIATALGSNAIATASNEVFIGDGSVTAVRSATGLFTTSDGRFKKDIKKNIPGLDFINSLNPVTYNYDIHKMNDFIRPNSNTDKKVNADLVKAQEAAIAGKEKILYSGFIAQEVETAAAKTGYDFSGLHKPENDKDPYASFVVPLVKAVQELSTENEELKSRLAKIEQMIGAGNSTTGSDALTNIKLSDVALDRIIPNPLVTATTIRYKLQSGVKKAELVIKDMTGKTIQQITLGTNTSGIINIDASSISSGVYTYSLVADGRVIESKGMVVAK